MSLIRFRQIEEDDLEMLRDWRNSPDVRIRCREYRLLNMPLQEWWHGSLTHDTDTLMHIIIANGKGKSPFKLGDSEIAIGVAGWTFIDWRSGHALISIYVGEEKYRTDEYYAAILQELHRIAFKELRLETARAEIYDFDPEKQIFYKAGYEETGRRKGQYFHDGKLWDIIVMSISKKDYLESL